MIDERTRSQYEAMRWNSPLGQAHADRLLDALALESAGSLLDLGCGWGAMLLYAAQRQPEGAHAIGVDSGEEAIEYAQQSARERGLADRVTFTAGDATRSTQVADVVMCSGVSHAWEDALGSLRANVAPAGRMLFGDAIWVAPPNPAAVEIFGEKVTDLDGLITRATAGGWRVRISSESDQDEWDEFEATFRAGDENWARAHLDDPAAATVLTEVEDRRVEYETVYRGVLGFAFLILDAA
jgi:SAM-dependent methyltransferase